MRSSARLVVAVIVVPAVVAAVMWLAPLSNIMMLVVGWGLTAVASGAVLWPRYGNRTMGWPLVLASVVYFVIIVGAFAVAVGGAHDSS